jgi:hypothetical protein
MNKKIVLFTLALLTGLGAYAQKNIPGLLTWLISMPLTLPIFMRLRLPKVINAHSP